ncbi:MAG: protein phosphatase 2C domain-containing protein [Bacteroidota bacterium]
MKIHQFVRIGEHHENHCEDSVLSTSIGSHSVLLAVMDGCTMGDDSYFASKLIANLLKKIGRECFYKEYLKSEMLHLNDQLKQICKRLFEELVFLKNHLQLEINELLSTVVLGVVDIEKRAAEIIVIGDGVLVYNDEIIEYDQDNVPDYIGYHLNANFEEWYERQEQRLSLEAITQLSLSTDGIFTFSKYDQKSYPEKSVEEIINYLLIEVADLDNERMLLKKIIKIEKEWGLKATDDLGIVSLRLV